MSSSKRIPNVMVIKPIIYGSVAQWLGPKAEETRTHKWHVYLRPATPDDDLSYIRRVIFTLHPTFQPPVITVDSPPFEIENYGWGEFEILMKLEFVDVNERPVEVLHRLRLWADGMSNSKKPVVSENYDELLFYEPRESFHKILNQKNVTSKYRVSVQDMIDQYGTPLAEQRELKKVKDAMEIVDACIKELEGVISSGYTNEKKGKKQSMAKVRKKMSDGQEKQEEQIDQVM